MSRIISAVDARALIHAGEEVAFLDVREPGQFGEEHPLLAIPAPYSTLEVSIGTLVPRKTVPVVLLDAGDGVGERAADRLASAGYTNVQILDGGMPGWANAGFPVYRGVNVPSKLFGELVEHERDTPSISAEELESMMSAGERLVVLDGRSPEEFYRMSIPQGQSCPNAELPLRLDAIVDDGDTTVVINCAGRTRSIMGAQGLIDMGIGSKVVALRNGTMGWSLAGFELEHGSSHSFPTTLDSTTIAQARARSAKLAAQSGVRSIGKDVLEELQADAHRSVFLLDVRTEAEFMASHVAGAMHAPGGQLVQATDQWIGVRNATVVLIDPLSIRAVLVAHWLTGMGHTVYVLEPAAIDDLPAATGPEPVVEIDGPPAVDASALASALSNRAACFDVRASAAHSAGHPQGARWVSRPQIASLTGSGSAVVLASDLAVGRLAAWDLGECGWDVIGVCLASQQEWEGAGVQTRLTPDSPPDGERVDYLFFVHDRHSGNLEAAQVYLNWETGLLAQMDDVEQSLFHVPAC